MSGLLALGSLLLGLVAWLLPVIGILIGSRNKHKNLAIFSLASVSACATFLCLQLFSSSYMVRGAFDDGRGLIDAMDAAYTVAVLSLLFLVATIVLNVIILVVCHKITASTRSK